MSVANNETRRSEFRVHPHHERSDVPSKGGLFRPQWRSVKKNRVFSVKNEKLFERSEFFSFRKNLHFLASEREPANFLFVSFFFCSGKRKMKTHINKPKPHP